MRVWRGRAPFRTAAPVTIGPSIAPAPRLAPSARAPLYRGVPKPILLAGERLKPPYMLASFRAFAKTPFATGILVLAMAGFLFVGGRSIFSATGGAPNAVISAGGRTVSPDDFRQIFTRALADLAQRNGGQTITPQDAVAHDVDRRLLDEMSQEEALAAWIARSGVRPSDALVADQLRRQPQFFNPVSGVFDKAAYAQILAQNGLTPQKFERDLRDQTAQTQVLTGLVAGLQAPAAYAALQTSFNKETRQFSWFALPVTTLPPPPKPTDAELAAFLKSHAAQLQKPPMRQVSLVRFSASLLAPTTTVSDADLRKRYDFEKDSLSTPEQRTFVQVAVASPAQAQAVAAALQAGQDAGAAAKGAGAAAPTPYVDAPRSAVPDAGLAAAVFAMAPGEVKLVQGSLGRAVVKLSAVKPGHVASFEEARPRIEQEVRHNLAAAQAGKAMQAYDDARQGGADFAEAARRSGTAVTTVPPFDAQGHDLKNQPLPVPPKLVQTAFALAPGATSDVLDAAPGKGEFYAIRLDAASPAQPYTLDEVREPVTREITIEALAKALRAKADALADRIRKGETVAAVAASAGHAPQTGGVSRDDQAAVQTYGQAFFGAVFGAKAGEVGVAPDQKANGFAIYRLDAVRAPPPIEVARAAQAVRQQATLALYEDLAVHARAAATARIKPRTNPALARKATGVEAPPASGPNTSGATGSGAGGAPAGRR